MLRDGEQRHSRAIFGSGVLRSFVPSALVRAGSMRRGPAAEQWRPIRDRYVPTTGYRQRTERGRDCGRTIDSPSGRGARRVSDPDGPLVGTCPGRWHTPLVRTGCADVDHAPSASSGSVSVSHRPSVSFPRGHACSVPRDARAMTRTSRGLGRKESCCPLTRPANELCISMRRERPST